MNNYQKVKQAGTKYDSYIRAAAEKYNVSYDLMHKMIYVESRFKPDAVSPTGATGIAQFVKATAKAYGLTPEDRKDPIKSIDAMGRHMRDLLVKTDGDESLAALAYNQGLGGSGRKQQKAFLEGKLDQVSAEGLKYMKLVQDAIKPEQVGRYKTLTTETPKGQEPKEADRISDFRPAGLDTPSNRIVKDDFTGHQQDTTGEDPSGFVNKAGQAAGLGGIKSEALPQPVPTVQPEVSGADPKGIFTGTGTAIANELANSTVGLGVRALRDGRSFDVVKDIFNPLARDRYQPDDEDYKFIDSLGLPASYVKTLSGASSREALHDRAKLAAQSYKNDQETAQTGVGAQIIGSVVGAAGSPLTYVPIVGQAGKAAQGMRLVSAAAAKRYGSIAAQSGAVAGVDEYLREKVVGTEADYATAIAGGALFGAGFGAGLDAVTGTFNRSITRLEANESARLLGIESDANMRSIIEDEAVPVQTSASGVDYKDNPVGDGSVILMDGSVISADSPLNPKQIEKSAFGVKMGDMTEVGLKVLSSKNTAVREMGLDWFRSSVGLESGASGARKVVVADVHDFITSRNRRHMTDFNKASQALLDTPNAYLSGSSRESIYDQAWAKVVQAIENPEAKIELTKAEKDLMKTVQRFTNEIGGYARNPSQFGNKNAKALLDDSIDSANYIPRIMDDTAIALNHRKYANTEGGLAGMLQKSFLHGSQGYYNDPKVKARVDKFFLDNPDAFKKFGGKKPKVKAGETAPKPEVTPEMVEAYAKSVSTGIANGDQFSYSAVLSDLTDPSGIGIENNKFLMTRHPFSSRSELVDEFGEKFMADSMRSYRLDRILPAYGRRMTGDISVMGATGKSLGDWKQKLIDLGYERKGGDLKNEGEAFMTAMLRTAGMSTQAPEGIWGNIGRLFQSATFASSNAWMGIQNFTEAANLIVKGMGSSLFKGVPLLNKLIGGVQGRDPKTINALRDMVFGMEIDDSIRPRRSDIRERIQDSVGEGWGSNLLADARFAMGELSQRMPTTKLLQGTTNYIVDAARSAYLNKLVTDVMGGKVPDVKAGIRKSAAITDEQFKDIQDWIKEYVKPREDGKGYKINPAGARDPRKMSVWRLGDNYAREAIQRSNSLSDQASKDLGVLGQIAMQFKNFVVRGINSSAIRSYYEATKNGRPIEMAASAVVAAGLAMVFHMGRSAIVAETLPESDREKFIKNQFDPTTLMWAGVSRSRYASPIGASNIITAPLGFDPAANVRTSLTPRRPTETDRPATFAQGSTSPIAKGLDQVPVAGMAANIWNLGANTKGLAESSHSSDALAYQDAIYDNVRSILPNDPVTQWVLKEIFENNIGIYNR